MQQLFTVKKLNHVARQSANKTLLERIEKDPAQFGKALVQHPSYLVEVVKSNLLEEAVEVMKDAGLNDMLWAIACNIRGYVPARKYIKDVCFS